MSPTGFSTNLPITDRRTAYDFYSSGMRFKPVGALADDGIPEPMQFDVGNGALIMLVPSTGFRWSIGQRQMTDAASVGCVLSLEVGDEDTVTATYDAAIDAGATAIVGPSRQPWGLFAATFADPDGNVWMISSSPER
jgi:uncharacterized glyoxalase superfamily protein PhnB